VSQRNDQSGLLVIASAFGWPILLGAAATSLFYVLIHRGPFDFPLMHRYFASHPVALIATCMFFVGMAALLLKAQEVMIQYWALGRVQLEDGPPEGQPLTEIPQLLGRLTQLPESSQACYLGRRLHNALQAA
jgi:hypothetical protein